MGVFGTLCDAHGIQTEKNHSRVLEVDNAVLVSFRGEKSDHSRPQEIGTIDHFGEPILTDFGQGWVWAEDTGLGVWRCCGVISPDLCDTGRSTGSFLGVGSFFSELRVSRLKNSSTL